MEDIHLLDKSGFSPMILKEHLNIQLSKQINVAIYYISPHVIRFNLPQQICKYLTTYNKPGSKNQPSDI